MMTLAALFFVYSIFAVDHAVREINVVRSVQIVPEDYLDGSVSIPPVG
jgi:hypothetical protein